MHLIIQLTVILVLEIAVIGRICPQPVGVPTAETAVRSTATIADVRHVVGVQAVKTVAVCQARARTVGAITDNVVVNQIVLFVLRRCAPVAYY